MTGFQLMLPPFVACMVLVAMLSYLGLHVIAREVIFVDLSLAQIAALGGLVALLFVGHDSPWRWAFALWFTWPGIARLAAAYVALGAFQFALRRKFLTISFHPEEAQRNGWKIRWWDFWFYLSFGIVITLAVPVGGVLMVFSFLVVPAVIAFLFTRDMRRLPYIAWGSGAVASLLGLWISFTANLPTGPLIVCMYGLLLGAAALLRRAGVGQAA